MQVHAAASRTRTLSGGAVCVLSAPEEESGRHAAVLVDADGSAQEPVWVAPESGQPGWQILDFLSADDGGWTVLELIPGPPDRVQARGIAPDGTTAWREAATAGAPEALRQLLEGPSGMLAVSGGRLVAIEAQGALTELQPLDADGDCYADGTGRVGFVRFDEQSDTRTWVTVEIGGGGREVVPLAPDSAWALDLPLGMDALGRPYGNRQGTLVRVGRAGRGEWELEVRQVVIEGTDVWIAQAHQGGGVRALRLSSPQGAPVALHPQSSDREGAWRLAGRTPEGFVLHQPGRGSSPGTLATAGGDGSLVDTAPAPEDVWLRWFDLQSPRGPAVTADGSIDVATRGPEGLHLVRLTPEA